MVYGKHYTKITVSRDEDGDLYYIADEWQYVFGEFALAEGRAPFLYRLCELAVRHWDYDE